MINKNSKTLSKIALAAALFVTVSVIGCNSGNDTTTPATDTSATKMDTTPAMTPPPMDTSKMDTSKMNAKMDTAAVKPVVKTNKPAPKP